MNRFSKSQSEGKDALDNIIRKSRSHMYKPIQIAEILYRNRVCGNLELNNLENYRNQSKRWRDEVCRRLVGRTSTSSQKFQDNLFDENAIPPRLLIELGNINRETGGSVECYIYYEFKKKLSRMNVALDYCNRAEINNFDLGCFLNIFRNDSGLKRSIDKIYEIVVYAMFSSLIETMGISISIKIKDPSDSIFEDFSDFSEKILGITKDTVRSECPAKLFRLGITNAADRGLDMWGNFGLAIQIKYLSLTEKIVKDVSNSVDADRIIIVCKDAEECIISSIISQLGLQSKIQAIVTLNELQNWYTQAFKLSSYEELGDKILCTLSQQIELEFPSSKTAHLKTFFEERGYRFSC